ARMAAENCTHPSTLRNRDLSLFPKEIPMSKATSTQVKELSEKAEKLTIRDASIVLELMDKFLTTTPAGNYPAFIYLSEDERELMGDIADSLEDLEEYLKLEDATGNGTASILRRQLKQLWGTITDRSVDHSTVSDDESEGAA